MLAYRASSGCYRTVHCWITDLPSRVLPPVLFRGVTNVNINVREAPLRALRPVCSTTLIMLRIVVAGMVNRVDFHVHISLPAVDQQVDSYALTLGNNPTVSPVSPVLTTYEQSLTTDQQ